MGNWRMPLKHLGSRASRRPRLNFTLDHNTDTLRPSISQARQSEVRKGRKIRRVHSGSTDLVVAFGPVAGRLENECSGGIDIVGIENYPDAVKIITQQRFSDTDKDRCINVSLVTIC